MKNAKYNDLEDMVYRMHVTYDEIMDIINLEYIPTKRTRYSSNPNTYEINDITTTLKHFLPNNVKANFTTDVIRLKSNLHIIQSLLNILFNKKSFFYTRLGFIQIPSGVLGGFESFIWLNPGSLKSHKPANITGIDKVRLKCDCVNGSIVNGIREPILYRFALDKPPG